MINIIGLSAGISCSLLILLWISEELSYDRFHPNAENLYQLYAKVDVNNGKGCWITVPLPLYEELKTAHSGIKNTVVMDFNLNHVLKTGEKKVLKKGYFVSEEFLDMFRFPLVAGNASSALNDPYSIVITEKIAKLLFGNEDPLNKIIRVDDQGDLKVTGVLKDIPGNSSLQFEYLVPWKYKRSIDPLITDNEDNWGNYSFQVFVELNDKNDLEEVNKAIEPIVANHGGGTSQLFIYPMLRWRLHSNFENGVEKGGLFEFVQLFFIISIFLLLIACVNFINLSTARARRRAREIGIRKGLGSKRGELIFQFLSESLILTFISYLLANLIIRISLPFYNRLIDKQLVVDYFSLEFLLVSLAIIVITGLIAGSYPAFYLSSIKPIRALKGNMQEGRKNILPRKVLVIFQFCISIMLIIGTIVIYKQIILVKNRELGYNKDNLIMIEKNRELDRNYIALKNELLNSGLAESMTSSNTPITDISANNLLDWPGKTEDQKVLFKTIVCGFDFAETMGIRLYQGRDFSEHFPGDSSAILINKAALDIMNLKEPVGIKIRLWGQERELIGVLDNVLMGSPFQEIQPLFAVIGNWGWGFVTIRIPESRDLNESLLGIEELFKTYNPSYPFEYRFADLEFDKKFESINRSGKLANLFSALAILITGMGILGFAAYSAEQRKKEVGIRKVMGASVLNIIHLMTRNFSLLVLAGFIIGAPLSYWILTKYLDRYPIHTEIDVLDILFTGIFSLAFTYAVVTLQIFKTANSNPVNTLREE